VPIVRRSPSPTPAPSERPQSARPVPPLLEVAVERRHNRLKLSVLFLVHDRSGLSVL
jgi:hypothetical protein